MGQREAAHIPDAMHTGLQAQRSAIKDCFDAAGKDMKADGGVTALPVKDRQAAEHLFAMLADYGIFVVHGGELEHWLKNLAVPGKKTDWTVAMLERLGSEPGNP